MANDQDVVWVDVLPSMDKLVPSLRRALPSAGRQAGEMFGQSLSDAAASKVDQASSKMTGALKKVQDAAGQVAVAEAKLQALRDKEVTDAGRVAAAEEAVARARRSEIAANEALSGATRGVAAAQEQLATAERLSAAVGDKATRQAGELSRAQSTAAASTGLLERAHRAAAGVMGTVGAVASRAWLPVTATLVAAGGLGLKTASNMEQAQIGFTNMLGSGQKAQAFLQQLSQFAAKTPFEFADVTRASQRLMAMGIQSKDVIPYLTAIGDSVAALGGGAEQIDQVTTAIGQMQAKGKIQSDEILQLTEAGIPALQILANSYGVTNGQMQDMITKGQVLSTDALPKLISGLETGTKTTQAFGGMMAQQSQSLSGLWSTVKDTVTMDLSTMWTPLIPALKTAMDRATPVVGKFLSDVRAEFGVLAKQIPNLFSAIGAGDSQGIGEVVDNIFGNTGGLVAPVRAISDQLLPVLHQAWDLLGQLRTVAGDLGPALGVVLGGGVRLAWQAFQVLLPAVTNVLGFLDAHQPLLWSLVGLWGALTVATQAHAAALAVEAEGSLISWVRQAVQVESITKAWAAVQWVLNTAMDANPFVMVGIALVALGVAIYEAWQHSQTFRDIVMGVWRAIGDAAQWVWNTVLKPVVDGIVTGWNAVGDAFGWVWTNVIKVAWDALSAGAQWLWGNVLHPIFDGISTAWNAVATAIVWGWDNVLHPVLNVIGDIFTVIGRIITVLVLGAIEGAWWLMVQAAKLAWDSVLHPVFDAIASVAQWLWTNVLQPVWGAMQAAWNGLLTGIQWAWQNILQPAWNAIKDAAQWLWNNIIQPIIQLWQAQWRQLMTDIDWVWNNILKPAWGAIQDAIGWLWNNILQPIFGFIGSAWDGLMRGMRWVYDNVIHPMWDVITGAIGAVQKAFEAVVKGISTVWNTLMDVLATPINFVIEVIFNQGLFKAWNWAIGALGLPADWKAPHWDQLPRGMHFADGGQVPGYAGGGEIPGPYLGPTADNMLGLVGGHTPIRVNPREWIQPVDAVDYYGADVMSALQTRRIDRGALQHAMAITGYAGGGQIPGYAPGGQVNPNQQTWSELNHIRQQLFPGSVVTDAFRPGANDWHGRGDAIDIGWAGNDLAHLNAIAAKLAQMFPNSTELIHNPNGSIKNGRVVPPGFWGAATWAEHLNHVHWAMTPEALAQGNANPGGGNIFGDILSVFTSLSDSITGPIGNFTSKFGGSGFAGWVGKLPGTLLGKMWDGIKGAVGAIFSSPGDTGPGRAENSDQDVVGAFKSMMQSFGWGSGDEWHAVDYLISHESSWNPRAQNPGSSASGLVQMIDSTWRANRPGSANAFAHAKDAPAALQASAFGNYIGSVYGDPIRAMQFWMANQYYGAGGPVHAFANGGLVPDYGGGTDSVRALVTPDERVQTPPQDRYTARLVAATMAAERTAGRSAPLIDQVTLQVRDNDSVYAAFDVLEHRMTVADMGGRYARTTTP